LDVREDWGSVAVGPWCSGVRVQLSEVGVCGVMVRYEGLEVERDWGLVTMGAGSPFAWGLEFGVWCQIRFSPGENAEVPQILPGTFWRK